VLRCHPKPDRWKLKMYAPMLVCFFLGAAAGTSAFDRYGRSSLLFPTSFLFCLGWVYIYYLARSRHQPFHKILLKRVSGEILTPQSPSHARKRRMPHMPHMPQIHIPFQHHHSSGSHSQQQHARAHPHPHPQHGRRHSSACDELGKMGEGRRVAGGGSESDQPQQIVLDISGAGPAASVGGSDSSSGNNNNNNEISNHTAAVV
jgi:hypothetical protein